MYPPVRLESAPNSFALKIISGHFGDDNLIGHLCNQVPCDTAALSKSLIVWSAVSFVRLSVRSLVRFFVSFVSVCFLVWLTIASWLASWLLFRLRLRLCVCS